MARLKCIKSFLGHEVRRGFQSRSSIRSTAETWLWCSISQASSRALE